MTVYNNSSEVYNKDLKIYINEYKALSDIQKIKLANKYDSINSFLVTCNYDVWLENEESGDSTRKIN